MSPQWRPLAELTREQAREASDGSLLVWPVGSTEQHGPHLPLGTDAMGAEWVARAAAAQAGEHIPIVMAPTLWLGSSAHHLPFGGTMSLDTDTYLATVGQGLDSLVESGFGRIFILNGHGGNHELIQLAARDVALKRDCHVAAGSWWAMAWDELVAAGAADLGRFPGHAGRFETSIVMAMRPDLVTAPLPHRDDPGAVDARHFGGRYRAEHHGSWGAIDGYGDSPDLGSADMGQVWLEVATDAVAAAFMEFHASADRAVEQ